MLESYQYPITGSGSESIFLTTYKVLCKKILRSNHLSTPSWAEKLDEINPSKTYLLKPVSEDGSVGIDDNTLIKGSAIKAIPVGFFAEEYIDGREFNVSIIGNPPTILPPAEMCFNNYDSSKPKILGYKSKWEENSFEYKNTTRSFNFGEQDFSLLENIKAIAFSCWQLFRLKGYARVDIRVGGDQVPCVIEINANPCIAPDSGFIAACHQAGMDEVEIIKRIIEDADR
jgi:D-alanine-D-alanine ligase